MTSYEVGEIGNMHFIAEHIDRQTPRTYLGGPETAAFYRQLSGHGPPLLQFDESLSRTGGGKPHFFRSDA